MITVLATVLVLGVLIFIHEFGHFLLAKAWGSGWMSFPWAFPQSCCTNRWGTRITASPSSPWGGT